jgi:hypothetical protein
MLDDRPPSTEVVLHGTTIAWLAVTHHRVDVRRSGPDERRRLARPVAPVSGLALRGHGVSFVQAEHRRVVLPRRVPRIRVRVAPHRGGVRQVRTLDFIARNAGSGSAVYDVETADNAGCNNGLLKIVRHVRSGQRVRVPLAPEPRWCGPVDHGTVFFEYPYLRDERCGPRDVDCSADLIVAHFAIGIRR